MSNNEEIDELKKRLSELEKANRASIEAMRRIAQEIDKISNKSNIDHLAIQVMAKELNIRNELYGKIEQRGLRFERDLFL